MRIQGLGEAWLLSVDRLCPHVEGEIEDSYGPVLARASGRNSLPLLSGPDRVNLDAGRVKPWLTVDASAAVDLYRKESRLVRLQGDISNLNDRLNAINFTSIFSGTAIAAPRSFSLRLRFDY